MRSVKRTKIPNILINNEKDWTEGLLVELNKLSDLIDLNDPDRLDKINKGCVVSKVGKTIQGYYSHDEIRQALQAMYNKRCCYCEGKISAQTYDHIEHLRPKSKFPHLAFSWDNLHCCCEVCHIKKGDKWNELDSILDPTLDNISQYIDFDLDTGQVAAIHLNRRALRRIEDVQLNREELILERKEVMDKYRSLLTNYTNSESLKLVKDFIQVEMLSSSYPSLHEKIYSLL